MKKIYFIYVSIPTNKFERMKYFISNIEGFRLKRDKMFGLYAWTSNKSIATEFFEVRNKDIYTLVKKDVDEEEYDRIKDNFAKEKLDRRIYYFDRTEDKDKSISIVSTKNEYICSTVDSEEFLYDFGFCVDKEVKYYLFNEKIQNALDILGFINNYILRYGNNDEISFLDNNMSYGLTYNGCKFKMNVENQMNILIYLFDFFFKGCEKGESQ